MNTIQSIIVYNNAPASKKINVEKLIYNPSYVTENRVVSEQCIIATQRGTFSAWSALAEECIIHLVKGESLCCSYTTEEGKKKVVQINGCNSTKTLSECYNDV